MYVNSDHPLAELFDKRNKDHPKLGTTIPMLGTIPDYNPLVDNYPEEIHHRFLSVAMQCGSYMREGWYDLVLELDDAISKIYPFYTIRQVKDKFGGLRYYIGGLPPIIPETHRNQIYDLIHEAEEKSYTICDICGEPGKTMKVGEYLIATRCKNHDSKED